MTVKVINDSRCTRCLDKRGCFPWALPWWETVIHSIPIIGIATSLTAWGIRSCKVIPPDVRSSSPGVRRTVDSPVALSPESQTSATLLGKEDYSESDSDEDEAPRLDHLMFTFKKANTAAIFWVNLIGSAAATTALFALNRFSRL